MTTATNPKYNTIMPESDDRTVCIMVDRPISQEGYLHNFLPKVDIIVKTHGELRILIYYKEFQGWEETAALLDMFSNVKYGSHVAKLAFVNPPETEIFNRSLKKSLHKGETRFFPETALEDAVKWVKK